MTKSKHTKRALLASSLSVLLCLAMLVGSTFAWFTDNATTSVNTIESGTLDLDLVDGQGASLEGETLNFVKAEGDEPRLWEPGCTYSLPAVYVKNNGNLALKYKLMISGIVGDAKLLEAIDWTITKDGDEIDLANFQDSLANAETSGSLVLTGHMQETAGNEYQNLSIDGIAITVAATQDTVEFDSFNNTYDALAAMPLFGGSFVLSQNYALTDDLTQDTVIDLNGKTLTVGDNTDLVNGADLTVTGGTVERSTFAGYVDVRPESTTDGVITYTDVTFKNNQRSKSYGSGTNWVKNVVEFCPQENGGATFLFQNCVFNNASVLFEGLSGVSGGHFVATFDNCTFNNLGGSGIKVDNYLTGTLNIKDCTFNSQVTTSYQTCVGIRDSAITVNFQGTNNVNGTEATPTNDPALVRTVNEIIVDTPTKLRVIDKGFSADTYINGLDSVVLSDDGKVTVSRDSFD